VFVSGCHVFAHKTDSTITQQLSLEFKQNMIKNLVWTFTKEYPYTLFDSQSNVIPLRLKSNQLDSLLSYSEFNNYGWLSTTFFTDSSLAGEPLYLTFFNSNPVKVWLNGKLVIQAGNPSIEKHLEQAPLFNQLTVTGVTLPYGENTLLIEFSTHNTHLFFIDYRIVSIGINLKLTNSNNSDYKFKRSILFGGTVLLLILLLFIHLFLTYKSIEDFPFYVSLCTFFTLLNSFITFSDSLFNWTFAYASFFSIAFPISYMLSFYFYLLSVRKILKLPILQKYYIITLLILIFGTLYSIVFDYILGFLLFLSISTILFFVK
jgi:hypothetical protein